MSFECFSCGQTGFHQALDEQSRGPGADPGPRPEVANIQFSLKKKSICPQLNTNFMSIQRKMHLKSILSDYLCRLSSNID